MSPLSLNLIDCAFQRKVKPVHNLCLIVAGFLWMMILPLLFLENKVLATIAGYLVIFSILPVALFIMLSITFLFRKKVGEASIENNQLTVGNDSYALRQVHFKFNIDQSEWRDPSKNPIEKIKSLPIWGNYMILDDNKELEFEPSEKLTQVMDIITASGYEKRPALMVKTADLLHNLMSMLWAAS